MSYETSFYSLRKDTNTLTLTFDTRITHIASPCWLLQYFDTRKLLSRKLKSQKLTRNGWHNIFPDWADFLLRFEKPIASINPVVKSSSYLDVFWESNSMLFSDSIIWRMNYSIHQPTVVSKVSVYDWWETSRALEKEPCQHVRKFWNWR